MTTSGVRPAADLDLTQLARDKRVHFVGIAGAGMSALAEWLRRAGGHVDGCDAAPGEVSARLGALGIAVARGHDPAHVTGAAAVIATAAVPADHAELSAAREIGIPVLKRSVALASVVNRGTVAAIAGTHGKTTTTAMTTAILAEAGQDPTAFVGGTVAGWGGGLRSGADRVFIVEADEYDRSFHALRPHVAAVTSIEADHLDVYGSLESVHESFRTFVAGVHPEGLLVACADDKGAISLLEEASTSAIAYGTGPHAELRAVAVEHLPEGSHFVVELRGNELGALTVAVPGLHNVRNALAAFAVARHLGADFASAARALAEFRGVGRRFEHVAASEGFSVIDDYAHHPTEIVATLRTARQVFPGRRLVAAFQPHLYTRTRDFADAFGTALAIADEVWVTDIYAAREAPLPGVSAGLIVAAARSAGASRVQHAPSLDDLTDALVESLRPGDVLVGMGAGNIDHATRAIARRIREREGRA